MSPAEFVSRPELRLNSQYYLTKQVTLKSCTLCCLQLDVWSLADNSSTESNAHFDWSRRPAVVGGDGSASNNKLGMSRTNCQHSRQANSGSILPQIELFGVQCSYQGRQRLLCHLCQTATSFTYDLCIAQKELTTAKGSIIGCMHAVHWHPTAQCGFGMRVSRLSSIY